jgi:hypothetical protein
MLTRSSSDWIGEKLYWFSSVASIGCPFGILVFVGPQRAPWDFSND